MKQDYGSAAGDGFSMSKTLWAPCFGLVAAADDGKHLLRFEWRDMNMTAAWPAMAFALATQLVTQAAFTGGAVARQAPVAAEPIPLVALAQAETQADLVR